MQRTHADDTDFADRLRVANRVGMCPTTYAGRLSLPSAEGQGADRIAGRYRLGRRIDGLSPEHKVLGSNTFEPSSEARRRLSRRITA